MKRKMLLLVTFLLLTAACGQLNQGTTQKNEEANLEPVQVQIEVPAQVEPEEEVEFQAVVTQGKEKVTNADEVEFEVWREGEKESSQLIKAEHQGEGRYTISKSFDTEGSYFIQSHVTARDMHVMPQATFVVGSAANPDKEKSTPEDKESHQHADNGTAHHQHQESPIDLKVKVQNKAIAGEIADVTVQLSAEANAFSNAIVSLEITKENMEKPIWKSLEETKIGIYNGSVLFPYAGEYKVTVHVKKGNLHNHQKTTIEITE